MHINQQVTMFYEQIYRLMLEMVLELLNFLTLRLDYSNNGQTHCRKCGALPCPWKHIRLYADDTCISFKHKNIENVNEKLDEDFNSLGDWFLDNKLSIYFGDDKTKTILFSPSKNEAPLIVERNNFVEFLGCFLDNTLSGKDKAEKV